MHSFINGVNLKVLKVVFTFCMKNATLPYVSQLTNYQGFMKEKEGKKTEKFLVGKKIKSFRALNEWTQQEVADKLTLSLRAYQDIENDITDVSVTMLEKIANTLNTNILELLGIGEGRFYFMYKGKQNPIVENGDVTINNISEPSQELAHALEKSQQENAFLKEKNAFLEREIENLKRIMALMESTKNV